MTASMQPRRIQASGEGTAGSVITVPVRWLRLLRRLLALQNGRYILVLTVADDHCDWSVQDVGKVEH